MSAARPKVREKFSVRLDPEIVAVVDDTPVDTLTLEAIVSRASAICEVERVVVPSGIIAAVIEARPTRSSGS